MHLGVQPELSPREPCGAGAGAVPVGRVPRDGSREQIWVSASGQDASHQ